MSDLDSLEAEFSWTESADPDNPGDVHVSRVPWSRPVLERADIRTEVVTMYTNAALALGQTPRSSGEH